MLVTSLLCLSLQFKCCGSNSSADWQHSAYILSPEAEGRQVPDSCCKTVVVRCGQRAHPSNIYKVEVSAQAPAGACRGPSRPPGALERQAQAVGRGAGHIYSLAVRYHGGLQRSPQSFGISSCCWEILGHHGLPPGHPGSQAL